MQTSTFGRRTVIYIYDTVADYSAIPIDGRAFDN